MRFFLKTSDFKKIKKNVHGTLHEYGGTFRINDSNKTMILGQVNNGSYDGIKFERGVVEFHTHPSTCKSNTECTIGLLSPEDLFNIAIGKKYGVQRHLVFSEFGTWSISLTTLAARSIFRTEQHTELYLTRLWTVFDELHRLFLTKRVSMNKYKLAWITEAKRRGFDIQLFPSTMEPYVDIVTDVLSKDELSGKTVAIRKIPDKYIHLLQRLASK